MKTAQEFIQNSFSPIIATLCSAKVENVVGKNNLTLSELLQPFTTVDWEGHIREPGGGVCAVKNFDLVIRDVNWKPLPPTEARRQLNNAVLHNYDEKAVPVKIEGHTIDIPQATPWFDAWRETYLEVQFPSDHEFTKHFLACIIVATTLDDNIIDMYNDLNQQFVQLQNVAPPKLPKWFNNAVLKSYLLIHDVSTVPQERADKAFETLKVTFGASNCFMLSINSKSSADPKLPNDFWAKYLRRSRELSSESPSQVQMFDSQTTFTQVTTPDEKPTAATSTNPEGVHPLTTTESDVYDNANSLEPYSFSGSSESVNVAGKTLDTSEIHGAALNVNDIDAIKSFLLEYVSKVLVPHLEKQIAQLSEVVANKKGVSRSLLSATKRWFTTGKTGASTVNNTVIYSTDCAELQLRRLGDLWFLCGQWQRAFDAYHTAKREFYADSAWLCYAGALEMAALSAFMAGEANRKTFGYMEESIVTYLNTCRMIQYAVRATLLSVPCLISSGLYGEAAKQLIRMTSEDSDLRSAMLLEQAALCFLKGPSTKIMSRKYAFHMVLAGHRFSKAGQKKHAYRCYKQAYQVYYGSGWRLSTDHVQFALGRLAGALRLPHAAASWLAAPLAPNSPQPAAQQDAFLREFMLAHQQWVESSDEYKEQLPVLPVPLLSSEETAVLCVGPAPLSSPGRTPATSLSLPPQADTSADDPYWHKLEETLLQVAQGSVPMIFKPSIDLYTQKTDSQPIVPKGEPIQISITLYNPLKVSLLLKEIELLWQFTPDVEESETTNEEVLNNETMLATGQVIESNVIHGQKIKSFLLDGDCKKTLNFTVIPLKIGQLVIQGLAFRLINVGEDKQNENGVKVLGKLNLLGNTNFSDKLLQIKVIPQSPCLQMTLSETGADVISGEILTVDVEFRNVGPVPLSNLYVAVSHPECMSVVSADDAADDFKALYDDKYRPPPDFSDERTARAEARARAAARRVALVAAAGAAAGTARATLLLRPTARAPRLYLLAYYETGQGARAHRLLRHVFRFNPTETVEILATPRRGLGLSGDRVSENMNLTVEIKNICNEKQDNITIEVLEATLLSRQWKLTNLTTSVDSANSLISRERAHLILKSARFIEEIPEGQVEYSCLKIAKHQPECTDDINKPPYSKFVTDDAPSLFDFIDTENNKDIDGLIRSMFVLRWKAYNKKSGRTTVGQHCLWLQCFGKSLTHRQKVIDVPNVLPLDIDTRTDSKEKTENNNVVVFKLEHSNYIDHDFKVNRLCMIPVVINIVNCYGVPVKVFIDMSRRQNRDNYGELGWAGALSNGLDVDSKDLGVNVTLNKFETRCLQVRALCASPGTYLVGSAFSVNTLVGADTRATTRFPNSASLLVVKQTA
ncbi:trafficking protein particle complex subunit 8 [Bicyclus anynana]|uniref:Trafficking protein particle complex subunit 8 n=1 Tax=Bicyclus anynana TaxID=110368 RepID=A0A6J1MXY8_BICAN|nr:trafficking protein particle complex subunit 8 [Bicyclus anynana]